MTAKAALCKALLNGRVVNIKNGFDLLGITNIPREIGRSVERAFGVKVSRTDRDGKSRYGCSVVWVDYRLPNTEENFEGIKKMQEYVRTEYDSLVIKTDKQKKQLDKITTPKKSEPVYNPLFDNLKFD